MHFEDCDFRFFASCASLNAFLEVPNVEQGEVDVALLIQPWEIRINAYEQEGKSFCLTLDDNQRAMRATQWSPKDYNSTIVEIQGTSLKSTP